MNINDYCKWRGDLPLNKYPFNEVDNLAVCYLTYTELDEILKPNEVKTIKELSDAYFTKHTIQEALQSKSFVGLAPLTLKAMAETKRFANCKVRNFVSILHEDTTEQFAALTIDLPNLVSVVCFRGTDDSLIGWHEDLMLSYTSIPAQTDAVEYLNKYCSIFRKYIVVGHSKGGHLALHASVNCKKIIQNRIIEIISNDGPGLMPGSYKEEQFNAIKARYKKYVPEFDIFGAIYDIAENKHVIKSDAFGIMQHSALSWQVEGNEFVKGEGLSDVTNLVSLAINDFLNSTTPSQREFFVTNLFEKMKEIDINNMSDFQNGGIQEIIKTLKALSELDSDSKKTAEKMLAIVSNIVEEKLKDVAGEFKEKTVQQYKKVGDKVVGLGKKIDDINPLNILRKKEV